MGAVGDILGRKTSTIHHLLSKHAPEIIRPRTRGRQRLPNSEFDKTRILYESGLSQEEVAELLGVTRGAILWRLKRAGVERRSHSDAVRMGIRKRRQRAKQTAPAP